MNELEKLIEKAQKETDELYADLASLGIRELTREERLLEYRNSLIRSGFALQVLIQVLQMFRDGENYVDIAREMKLIEGVSTSDLNNFVQTGRDLIDREFGPKNS